MSNCSIIKGERQITLNQFVLVSWYQLGNEPPPLLCVCVGGGGEYIHFLVGVLTGCVAPDTSGLTVVTDLRYCPN